MKTTDFGFPSISAFDDDIKNHPRGNTDWSDVVENIMGNVETEGMSEEELDKLRGQVEDMVSARAEELSKDRQFDKNEGYEVVNDKSLDAIKDNFTPPGAKGKMWKVGLYNTVGDKSDLKKFVREGDDIDDIVKQLREENPEYAKGGYDTQRVEEGEDLDEWLKLPGWHKGVKDEIDTNDNGEIEVDEMADFQKSLDDYASKNKKGRDDIPVTTRR